MSQPPTVSPLAVCLQLTHAISRTDRLDDIFEAALDALAVGLNVQRASIHLFDPDGAPRFTDASRHPIDGQCVAQSIESFALGASEVPALLADARRVLDFGLDRMRRRDGAFVFQRQRRFVNRAPHVRWVEAPMLSALVRLDEAERRAAPARGASR